MQKDAMKNVLNSFYPDVVLNYDQIREVNDLTIQLISDGIHMRMPKELNFIEKVNIDAWDSIYSVLDENEDIEDFYFITNYLGILLKAIGEPLYQFENGNWVWGRKKYKGENAFTFAGNPDGMGIYWDYVIQRAIINDRYRGSK